MNMTDLNSPENLESINITRACLMHVPFDGWSQRTLELAAQDCGFEKSDISRFLPRGVQEAVEIYARLADEEMILSFNKAMSNMETAPQGTTAKIKFLIVVRLKQAHSNKEVIRKTLQYLRNPKQANFSQVLLFKTIDQIWKAAGDKSTDLSFYTKRGLLSAVYSTTLLYFLADNSGSVENTSAFLDRRLREVSAIPKLSKPLRKKAEFMVSRIRRTASSVVKNIF